MSDETMINTKLERQLEAAKRSTTCAVAEKQEIEEKCKEGREDCQGHSGDQCTTTNDAIGAGERRHETHFQTPSIQCQRSMAKMVTDDESVPGSCVGWTCRKCRAWS